MTPAAEPLDLSVIIVNWNTRDMTLACLRSLYAQTRELRFETLVVDNGSHDRSAAAIAAEFPQVTLLAEEANHGFALANNIAGAVAKGHYLLLLNSDTLVLDGAVDRLVSFARATPEARIWGGRTVFGDGRLNIGSAWGKLTPWAVFCYSSGISRILRRWTWFDPEAMRSWDRSTERQVDIVSGCFFLIERAFWNELGGFDSDFFMYGEEADLCARARQRGARPRVTPDATIVHYGGASATEHYQPLVSVLGAKIALARKHMSASAAGRIRLSLTVGVAVRAALYAAYSRLTGRGAARALRWEKIWAHRDEWRRRGD